MVQLTFDETGRTIGYSDDYIDDAAAEDVIKTSESELSTIFQSASDSGGTLNGADSSIEAAIDDPLAFRDFLILDSNDSIAFDSDYARPKPDETQA